MNDVSINYDVLARSLIVNFRPTLDLQMKISSWETGIQIAYQNDLGWEPEPAYFDPRINIFDADSQAIGEFVQAIPADILSLVKDMPNFHITALRIMRFCPDAEGLCSNPGLFLLLSEAIAEGHVCYDELQTLIYEKRTAILARLLGREDGLNQALNLLKKVGGTQGFESSSLLKKVLSSKSTVSALRRFQKVPYNLLDYAIRNPEFVNSRFMQSEMSRNALNVSRNISNYAQIYTDALRIGGLLNIRDARERLLESKDFAGLNRLHDRWVERWEETRPAIYDEALVTKYGEIFPEPPLAGNEAIEPIITYASLKEEGKSMHHCVSSYAPEVFIGKKYVYRVNRPSRATLEIVIRKSMNAKGEEVRLYSMGELKGYCNNVVPAETETAVREWFTKEIQKTLVLKK